MQLRKTRRPYGLPVSIAPLIDVVFLLIIFFMTVSRFTRVEVEALTLPEAEKGEKAKPIEPGHLIVNVHKDGRIVVAGAAHTIESLGRMLAARVEEHGADNLTVVLRGDRDADWKSAASILRACAERGIARVRVAVVEPGAEP